MGIAEQDDIFNMAHIVGGMIGGMAGYVLNKEHENDEKTML